MEKRSIDFLFNRWFRRNMEKLIDDKINEINNNSQEVDNLTTSFNFEKEVIK